MDKLKNIGVTIITLMILMSCKDCNNKVSDAKNVNGAGGASSDSIITLDSSRSQVLEEDSSQINATHLSFTTCNADPNGSGPLIDSIIVQETTEWCWAASGQMVMKHLGNTTATQCDQANRRFDRNDCCNSPTPSVCVLPGFPEFDKYGFLFERTDSKALNWDDVKAQIACQSAPFCWTKKYAGGGGHVMVISGYIIDSIGEKCVYVLDPWPIHNDGVARMITYADYVTSQDGSYSHWDDFYNIRKE